MNYRDGPLRRFTAATSKIRAGIALVAGWKIALVVLAGILGLLFFIGLFVSSSTSATGSSQGCAAAKGATADIPPEYVPWLEQAAVKYHLGSRGFAIVAAVHKVETDFKRSKLPGVSSGTNPAGAAGPGQFLAGTWATYGVDADGDGVKDIYGIPDSVFATANYLRASGAPRDWRAALFAYNHAAWYVDEVLRAAKGYDGVCLATPNPTGPLGALPADPVQRLTYVARWIESQRIPYCWGGGHAGSPGPSSGVYCWNAAGRRVMGSTAQGLDCSGAVRWLLVLSGYPDPGGLRSDLLGAAYPAGPGQQVTIWSSPAHVFMTIAGTDWGTGSSHFAHGPAFGPQSHAGFQPSHPPGV
jgi:hypothetical protein